MRELELFSASGSACFREKSFIPDYACPRVRARSVDESMQALMEIEFGTNRGSIYDLSRQHRPRNI
jgi:hypothetical protein